MEIQQQGHILMQLVVSGQLTPTGYCKAIERLFTLLEIK